MIPLDQNNQFQHPSQQPHRGQNTGFESATSPDSGNMAPRRSFPAMIAPAVLILLSTAVLLLFGIAGVGRGKSVFGFDMQYLFVAGELWEHCQSPYNFDTFKSLMESSIHMRAVAFAYPPNSAPLAMALSLCPLQIAKALMAGLNFAALTCMAYFVFKAAGNSLCVGEEGGTRTRTLYAAISVALLLASPFTTHVMWMGQTTLLAAAPILLSWMFAAQRRDLLAGFFLGLAAFKPQLAFLFGLWFLLDRRWRLLATAALTAVALSVWPMLTTGLEGSWIEWLTALQNYQNGSSNIIKFRDVFGIRSMLAVMGLRVPSLSLLAVIAVVLLYILRKRLDVLWLPGAIFSISALFIYAHDYDLANVSLLAFPLIVATRGNWFVRAGLIIMMVVLFFPQRAWESVHIGFIARSRELALLAILAVYIVMCRRNTSTSRESAALQGESVPFEEPLQKQV